MTEDERKTDVKQARREEREALQQAVNDLGDNDGQRPEALRQFAQSSRNGEDSPKGLQADGETGPRPSSNRVKHTVAARLLRDGAEGDHPDPQAEGVDQLPDRIIDRG